MKELNMNKKSVGVAAVLIGAALFTGASSCDTKQDAPEPTPDNIVNGTNTHVIRMPDGFRNIAFTCFGPNGVYVTSRGAFQNGNKDATPLPSGVFVVKDDVNCPH